jgi:hypothetical protein
MHGRSAGCLLEDAAKTAGSRLIRSPLQPSREYSTRFGSSFRLHRDGKVRKFGTAGAPHLTGRATDTTKGTNPHESWSYFSQTTKDARGHEKTMN